ncbi:unnamed protein product [Prunus brigantina]
MGMCTFCCCSIILVALVFSLGITGFVSWIIAGFVRVSHLKRINYQVIDASLLQFNLTNNNTTLEYNLALNITLQNPNDKIGLHFDRIEASASFMKQTLTNVSLSSSSYLGHKKTVVLPALFKGQRPVALGADEVSNFKNAGDFDILLNLDVKYTVKFLASKVTIKQPHIACSLKVPLNNGKSAEGFKVTQCKAQSSDK